MQRLFKSVSILILVVASLSFTLSSFAATLTSTVDRNQVGPNETLLLTITLDQQANTDELDLSVLRQDFELLGISPINSSSFNMVNGRTTQVVTTQWKVTLAPKREGTAVIPAFTLAGASSQPISIKVIESETSSGTIAPIVVSVSADETDVFTMQQFIVTVQLAVQSDVSNLNGSKFDIANAEVRELGQSANNRIDNGVATQIISLRYALFAKQAGIIEIPALTFSGVQGGRRSIFGDRGGKRVAARSKPFTIKVNAPPAGGAVWLPSTKIEISSEFSGDPTQYQVGAPITRRLIVKAHGLSAEALPPLESAAPSAVAQGYKSYDDKPQLHTETLPTGLIGTRIESSAIVPSEPGELNLPEIRLAWWDVRERQWREAVLPTETLTIRPGSTTQSKSDAPTNIDQAFSASQTETSSSWTNDNRLWQGISALLLLVCSFQFVLLKHKSQARKQDDEKQQGVVNENKAWKRLKASLQLGDATDIRQDLLNWARVCMGLKHARTLSSLIQYADSPRLSAAISRLEASLYGNTNPGTTPSLSDDDIGLLKESLTELRQQEVLQAKQQTKKRNPLPNLYPQT